MRPTSLLPLLALSVACGGASYKLAQDEAANGQGGAYDTGLNGAPSTDSGDANLGSEDESSFAALRPATTPTYVFVANPDRGTVSRITAETLAVITAQVGEAPAVVLGSPASDQAVCFNQGSADLSVIDASTLAVQTIPIRPHMNQMVMSPDGRWVIVYHDAGIDDEEADGTQSFNEISLVDTQAGVHYPMVVGFDPHEVQFTDDSGRAVVVSDGWLAIIALDEAEPALDRVQISDELVDPPAAEEVLLDPQGRYAFVRQYGVSDLTVVDLDDHSVTPLEVGDNPTDLDVSPDGGQAVAVARGSHELWVYDLDDPWSTPHVVDLPTTGVFGSVQMSASGDQALLYSTASDEPLYATWDRTNDEVVVRGLIQPVQSVELNASGTAAVVFHPKAGDDGTLFANSWSMTLLALPEGFSNPIKLSAEPLEYASTEDGDWGFLIMEGQPYLEAIDFSTLLFDEVTLKSDPVHVGVLPGAHLAYASQQYDTGRISFYQPDQAQLQTITGFELNAEIEQ